jgi:centrosomal protein CEP78
VSLDRLLRSELYHINLGLEFLCPSLSENKSINVVDLSHNEIEHGGNLLGKMISNHGQRRNDIKWMYGLRSEAEEEDIFLSGMLSF